jgi:uncharacterized protein YlxP (DUF503 family)
MASFNFHAIKPIHILLLALLIPLWGVILDKLGLVQLTVGFLSGIFGTLALQALAVYYFILKIDTKQNQKRAKCVLRQFLQRIRSRFPINISDTPLALVYGRKTRSIPLQAHPHQVHQVHMTLNHRRTSESVVLHIRFPALVFQPNPEIPPFYHSFILLLKCHLIVSFV